MRVSNSRKISLTDTLIMTTERTHKSCKSIGNKPNNTGETKDTNI